MSHAQFCVIQKRFSLPGWHFVNWFVLFCLCGPYFLAYAMLAGHWLCLVTQWNSEQGRCYSECASLIRLPDYQSHICQLTITWMSNIKFITVTKIVREIVQLYLGLSHFTSANKHTYVRTDDFREFKHHVYGKRPTSASSGEFLKTENEQIKTAQNNSYG